jgi:uncharacterized membrane protein YwzB
MEEVQDPLKRIDMTNMIG